MRRLEEMALWFANQTAFVCRGDPRFSYYIYHPRRADRAFDRLIVLLHGSERSAELYRNSFKRFADAHNAFVVAPLFPAGYPTYDDIDNYRFLKIADIRFDLVLRAIVSEVRSRFAIADDKMLMHGFSAGGQFVHRFLYLYPEEVRCASIGAPGKITLLDRSRQWPRGTAGMDREFGKAVDYDAVRAVPAQIVVGERDSDPYLDGDEEHSRTLLARDLHDSFVANGMSVRLDHVPGVGHNGLKILDAVTDFFAEIIAKRQGAPS